jgi:hypothetical protein
MDLTKKTDGELNQWITNHEVKGATATPLYRQLLAERAQRAQLTQRLDFKKSLDCLKQAAIHQVCITYGDLAAASGVEWSQARHQMNGVSGHLDRLYDLCLVHGLPPLTALCVNQAGVKTGELGDEALAGFVAAARRLGVAVDDPRRFPYQCRDECWRWGREQAEEAAT